MAVATVTRTSYPRTARSGLRTRLTARPDWRVEVVIVLGIYVAYDVTRGFVGSQVLAANRNGRAILRWEQALHLSPEHLLNNSLAHVTALAVVAAYFYATLHYLVTPVVLIWLYRLHPERYGRRPSHL